MYPMVNQLGYTLRYTPPPLLTPFYDLRLYVSGQSSHTDLGWKIYIVLCYRIVDRICFCRCGVNQQSVTV